MLHVFISSYKFKMNWFINCLVLCLVTSLLSAVTFRFELSCHPVEYQVAFEMCLEKGGDILSTDDIARNSSISTLVVQRALGDHEAIWINTTKDCHVAVPQDIKQIDCSQHYNYICKKEAVNTGNRIMKGGYIPCHDKEEMRTETTSRATGTGVKQNSKPLQPRALSKSSVLLIGICVAVAVLLITIIVIICCVIKRHKKPKRYAVRVESALYHRNNPDKEKIVHDNKEPSTSTVDVEASDDVFTDAATTSNKVKKGSFRNGTKSTRGRNNSGFVTGVQFADVDANAEYDILWTKTSQSSATEQKTNVYGHLSRNESCGHDVGDCQYDTAAAVMDVGTLDNTYARTYPRH